MAKCDGDFLRFHLTIGTVNIDLPPNLDWPPPELICWDSLDGDAVGGIIRAAKEGDPPNHILMQTNRSTITDEQMNSGGEGMKHVARGAEYRYQEDALNS